MFLHQLLRMLPGGPWAEGLRAFSAGDYDGARRAFRDYLDRPGGRYRDKAEFHLCEACIQGGEEALAQGRAAEAALRFQEALALHPEYADVHNKLGEALEQLGRRDEAVTAFTGALARNPRFYRARLNLARVHLAAGDTAPAIDALASFPAHCPPPLRAQASDLVRLCRDGDLAAMRDAVDRLADARPDELALRRAQALAAVQRGDNRLAIALLGGLLEQHGHFADLHHLLGLAYGNAGMHDDAVLEFRQALAINPNYMRARINLGVALLEAGRCGEAAVELRLADEAEPYNPLVINALRQLQSVPEA
jgi:protein O-GlcNAc transferase